MSEILHVGRSDKVKQLSNLSKGELLESIKHLAKKSNPELVIKFLHNQHYRYLSRRFLEEYRPSSNLYLDVNLINAVCEMLCYFGDSSVKKYNKSEIISLLEYTCALIENNKNQNNIYDKILYEIFKINFSNSKFLFESLKEVFVISEFILSKLNQNDKYRSYILDKFTLSYYIGLKLFTSDYCKPEFKRFYDKHMNQSNFTIKNKHITTFNNLFKQTKNELTIKLNKNGEQKTFIDDAEAIGGVFSKEIFTKVCINYSSDEYNFVNIMNTVIGLNFTLFDQEDVLDGKFSTNVSDGWEDFIKQKFVKFKPMSPKQDGKELCDILFEHEGYLFVGELKFRSVSNINEFKSKGIFHYLNNLVTHKYFNDKQNDRGIFYQRKDRLVDIKKIYSNFTEEKIINFTVQPTIFCPKFPTGESYIGIMREKIDKNLPKVHVISISDTDKFAENPTKFLELSN